MVKIEFEFETEFGTYKDALYFEEGAVPSDAEVEVMKQSRVDNWMLMVDPSNQTMDQSPPLVESTGE